MKRLYDSRRWRRLRLQVLARDGWRCACCDRALRGGDEAKAGDADLAVVDHITPHRGNPRLFWDETNLQALAKACHDSRKKRIERWGFDDRVGRDGWPLDPAHPAA